MNMEPQPKGFEKPKKVLPFKPLPWAKNFVALDLELVRKDAEPLIGEIEE